MHWYVVHTDIHKYIHFVYPNFARMPAEYAIGVKFKQERQCTHNVKLRRVYEITHYVEKE
jgi:hypothetical protein